MGSECLDFHGWVRFTSHSFKFFFLFHFWLGCLRVPHENLFRNKQIRTLIKETSTSGHIQIIYQTTRKTLYTCTCICGYTDLPETPNITTPTHPAPFKKIKKKIMRDEIWLGFLHVGNIRIKIVNFSITLFFQ